MIIDKATIKYDNEIQITQVDDGHLELRQRWIDTDEFSGPFTLQADELRELVELAKFLGWEI